MYSQNKVILSKLKKIKIFIIKKKSICCTDKKMLILRGRVQIENCCKKWYASLRNDHASQRTRLLCRTFCAQSERGKAVVLREAEEVKEFVAKMYKEFNAEKWKPDKSYCLSHTEELKQWTQKSIEKNKFIAVDTEFVVDSGQNGKVYL
ncbi:hypothetical protein RFI_12449 [Reticulomyxa filosa]|uniref:Uncharacterized protein n=1 Tax=Reticulomyxa filosa TaxID=46433 RepID=X6NFN3_RETFI|nr:hypothetical protein RFI_12449 [Reticulomyxa filosa]|eukprot:ETO24708.1 hypothetical protein RFI_12449 [Reticulomyxa filosa]